MVLPIRTRQSRPAEEHTGQAGTAGPWTGPASSGLAGPHRPRPGDGDCSHGSGSTRRLPADPAGGAAAGGRRAAPRGAPAHRRPAARGGRGAQRHVRRTTTPASRAARPAAVPSRCSPSMPGLHLSLDERTTPSGRRPHRAAAHAARPTNISPGHDAHRRPARDTRPWWFPVRRDVLQTPMALRLFGDETPLHRPGPAAWLPLVHRPCVQRVYPAEDHRCTAGSSRPNWRATYAAAPKSRAGRDRGRASATSPEFRVRVGVARRSASPTSSAAHRAPELGELSLVLPDLQDPELSRSTAASPRLPGRRARSVS